MIIVKIIPDIFSQEGRSEGFITYPEDERFTLGFLVDENLYRKAGLTEQNLGPKDLIESCDVWYQGVVVNPEKFAGTEVNDCSEIVFFLRPGKGGIFQTIFGALMIAIGIYFPPLGPYLIPLGIGMMMGGIAAMLFTPEAPNFEIRGNKNYGWEGAKTEYITIGGMVPICYGRVITGGKCIHQRIYANKDNDQVLDLLLMLSEGEIRGIRKQDDSTVCTSKTQDPWIRLDGNFISGLTGATWDYRLGTVDQTAIPEFAMASTNHPDIQKLSENWYTIAAAGAGKDFETVEFNFMFPAGMYITGMHGVYAYCAWIEIQYKEEPGGSWTTAGETNWTEKKMGAFYKTVTVTLPTKANYSFRMKRISKWCPDCYKQGHAHDYTGEVEGWAATVTLQSYNRIVQQDEFRYPGTALVAVRAVATDQISSAQPNLEIKLDGRKTQYYDGATWQSETWGDEAGSVGRNPGWQLHDLIYNLVYGLGHYFDDTLKASSMFKVLADYADQSIDDGKEGTEKRFLGDVIVDGIVDPWDMLKELLRSCHSFPLVAGAQIWPVVEKVGSPVMSFGMDNVATDKDGKTLLQEIWRTLEDSPNVVEVQYFDAGKDYVRETVQYPDDDSIFGTDEKIRKLTVVFHNVSRRSQALRLAKYHWLIAHHVKRFIHFPTNEEALALQPGNIFYFSHDIPQFDYSGRIFRFRSGDDIIELDNAWDAVDVGHPENYKIMVRDLDDDTIQINDVTAITTENNRHLVTYTPQSADFTPAEGDPYVLIEGTTTPIAYVCTELGRDEGMRRTISAHEYVAAIYSYEITDVEEPDYSDLTNPNAPPDAPTDLTLTEMPEQIGFYVNAVVPSGQPNYDHCRIYLSTDGTYWDEIGRLKDVKNFRVTAVIPGITYHIKVVSYNRIGIPCTTAPTASITVRGFTTPPIVRGLEIFGQGNDNQFVGKDCKIQWKLATKYMGFGSGSLGNEGTGLGETLPHYIKSTKVSIYVAGIEVRTEFVPYPGNTYTYSLEKNIEDNGSADRTFEFRLWYQDNYNQLSPEPASLEVTNPAPSMAGLTPTVTALYSGLRIDWSNITPAHHDIDKYWIYCDANNPPTTVVGRVDGKTTLFYVTGLDADTTYYVKIVPGDPYGMGTASEIASQTPEEIPSVNIPEELRGNLTMSDADSNSEATLAALYDGIKDSGGVGYTASAWTKWVQYRFPVEYITDRIVLWTSVAINCYIAYSDDGVTWSYLKAEADHTLDANGKLLSASNESDAQTNYWTTGSGKSAAVFPNQVKGKYFRLYIGTSCTLRELIFFREIVAEMVVCDELSAIVADLGLVSAGVMQSSNWGAGAGVFFDLDNEVIKMGGSSSPKFHWDGTTLTLVGEGSGITNIDGGHIQTATITATQINGGAFGTLTITSGKIAINTTDALEIQAGGNVKILSGGDIQLNTAVDNPAAIVFKGSTYDITIAQRSADDYLKIYPSTAETCQLTFGKDTDNNNKYFFSYWFYASSIFQVRSGYTSGLHSEVHISSNYIRLLASDSGGTSRNLYFDESGGVWTLYPSPTAGVDLGTDTYYFNDINYKTLDDKGCLGVFDQGVEMPDGDIVSDLEALKRIEVDMRSGKETIYGVPMFDYRTMPKAVYRRAKEGGVLLPRDGNDEPYLIDKEGKRIPSADGAELSALVSIMIGAIKELDAKIMT